MMHRSGPGDQFTPETVPGSRPIQMSFGYEMRALAN